MNREKLKEAIDNGNIEWQRHALERMMERGISRNTVMKVLLTGEVIEDYADDKPFPSALFFGWIEGMPFHVVSAVNEEKCCCYIITAYRPGSEHFEADYKTRRENDG